MVTIFIIFLVLLIINFLLFKYSVFEYEPPPEKTWQDYKKEKPKLKKRWQVFYTDENDNVVASTWKPGRSRNKYKS